MKLKLTKATFQATNYMHIETNQLAPLVDKIFGKGASQKDIWSVIGSDAIMINLDAIDGANSIQTDADGDNILETHYLIPIKDEAKANTFVNKCAEIGMEVEIGTYEEAIELWQELKALKPIK